jgi:hypothetical protein
MEAIPEDWIDKIFECMALWYGERWIKLYQQSHKEAFYKVIWKNGLQGLSHDQIKHSLIIFKKQAEDTNKFPPHVMEFYRMAKGDNQSQQIDKSTILDGYLRLVR